MATQPTTTLCLVKKRLIAELESAHTRIVSIHNQKIEAVIRGDLVADASLVGELKTALERRDFVAQKLKEHIAQHGC